MSAKGRATYAKNIRRALRSHRRLRRAARGRAGHGQDRGHPDLLRPVRRPGRADRQRNQALHGAARRPGGRKESRNHPEGRRRPDPGRRQAARAGARGPRQGGHSRGIRAHPERDRRRRHLIGSEEIHGGDERRHVDHHDEVAVPRAGVGHRAAELRGPRGLGRQERDQENLHHGLGLRPRPGRGGRVPARLQGGRRRNRRLGPHARRQPGLPGLRPAHEGRQSGGDLRFSPTRPRSPPSATRASGSSRRSTTISGTPRK